MIQLNFTVSDTGSVVGYSIQRSFDQISWQEIDRIVGGSNITYVDNNPFPNSWNFYRARSFNQYGLSYAFSPVASGFAPAPTVGLPDKVLGLTAYQSSDTEMFLDWQVTGVGYPEKGFNIVYVGAGNSGQVVAPAYATDFSVTGLVPNTSYNFTIAPFNADGTQTSVGTIQSTMNPGGKWGANGRNPRLLMTPKWRQVWLAASGSHNSSYDMVAKLISDANSTNTISEPYPNSILQCALAYQLTQSNSYAQNWYSRFDKVDFMGLTTTVAPGSTTGIIYTNDYIPYTAYTTPGLARLWFNTGVNFDLSYPSYWINSSVSGNPSYLVVDKTSPLAHAPNVGDSLTFCFVGDNSQWWNPNSIRNTLAQTINQVDICYGGLTTDQQNKCLNFLNTMADAIINLGGATSSDYCIPYAGCLFIMQNSDKVFNNPRAGQFNNVVLGNNYYVLGLGSIPIPLGSISSSNIGNRTQLNDLLTDVALENDGGNYYQSSEYNLENTSIMHYWYLSLRRLLGIDHFPLYGPLLRQFAQCQMHQNSPDMKDMFKWGDYEQQSVGFWNPPYITYFSIHAGAHQNVMNIGPYMLSMINKWRSFAGTDSDPYSSNLLPYGDFYLMLNPVVPSTGTYSYTNLPTSYAAGNARGILHKRSGWNPSDSFFSTLALTYIGIDHEDLWLMNYWLYRHGERAINTPTAYGGFDYFPDGQNCLEFGGLTEISVETNGVQVIEDTPNYSYMVGATNGGLVPPGYFQFQPPIVEHTRSIFFLPSSGGKVDTVVDYIRNFSSDPAQLPLFEYYYSSYQAAITGAYSLKEWIFHTNNQPRLNGNRTEAVTPSGTFVTATHLLPNSFHYRVLNENTAGFIYPGSNYLAWQIRTSPQQLRPSGGMPVWDTFLNVVQAYDSGVTVSNRLIQSSGNIVEGAVLSNSTGNDTVVLFSGKQYRRLHDNGFGINFSTNTPAPAYIMDLNPHKNWLAFLDGSYIPVSISPKGVGTITIPTSGGHNLIFSSS